MGGLHFTRCYPQHIRLIEVQPVQYVDAGYLMTPAVGDVLKSTLAISGWYDNRCMGACGIIYHDRDNAEAWALLSKHAGPHMLQITRHVRFVLDTQNVRRLTMDVVHGHDIGHRWAKALGFKVSDPNKRAIFPAGAYVTEYERIR